MSEKTYPGRPVEEKWQKWWETIGLYRTPDRPRKKYYVLEMFPYPSGDLHMGHLRNYVIGDAFARFKMMDGFDLLHPMGWDAFGLPAENAAIQRGLDPKQWTLSNIAKSKEELKMVGLSYDWDREVMTCDPSYYKWTQAIFLLLYRKGLAYRDKEYVNWCPSCKTVLANEQVVNGRCERCKTPVTKKLLEQWFFKITAYAERLLEDLRLLQGGWPEHILKMQENWIGRSEGTEILFPVEGSDRKIPVFTTRADTLFGVTFLTVAPEFRGLHELIHGSPHEQEVMAYVEAALLKSDAERSREEREKTGVFTGRYALHPFTGERVPIYVADYVLAHYGTGAVMGVPAHDQRDFEFAKKHGLPIKVVIRPTDGAPPDPETMTEAFVDYGVMVNSGPFSGLPSKEGIRAVEKALEEKGLGGHRVTYRMRDWLISRQRYWGAPIPVVHCPRCGIVPVPEDQLPVLLPENVKNFLPRGRSPLEDVPEFMNTSCPRCGGPARRDPDTMDTFVDSSWYFLRFTDPHNDRAPFSKEAAFAWMPVDQYIGGAEHATKHLIYARFIHKVFYDEGLVPDPEPFHRLFNQGMVLKRVYECQTCGKVMVDEEEARSHPHQPLESYLEMMSKSTGNVVPVREFVKKNGADIARLYILFAAPAEKDFEWTDEGVEGARRFLNRVWRLFHEHLEALRQPQEFDPAALSGSDKELWIKYNTVVKEVRRSSESFGFNTAIARIMELVNALYVHPNPSSPVFLTCLRNLVLLLAPFTPHLAEELWHRLGHEDSVFRQPFPTYDEGYLMGDTVEIPVQINGRFRGTVVVPRDADQETVLAAARQNDRLRKYLDGKPIKRVVYVKNRLLNIVLEAPS